MSLVRVCTLNVWKLACSESAKVKKADLAVAVKHKRQHAKLSGDTGLKLAWGHAYSTAETPNKQRVKVRWGRWLVQQRSRCNIDSSDARGCRCHEGEKIHGCARGDDGFESDRSCCGDSNNSSNKGDGCDKCEESDDRNDWRIWNAVVVLV